MPPVVLEGPVVVVDDDLRPWRISDFEGLQEALDDPDVDEFKQLWEFAVSEDIVEETDDEATRIETLGRDDTINAIIENPTFVQKEAALWRRFFSAGLEARHSTLGWFHAVKSAVEKREAALTTYASHPDPNEIADAKLIVIDLILDDDPNPLRKATDYLKKLYAHRSESNAPFPLVVLVSQNAAELEGHRQEFRHDAQISASMLRMLEKSEISNATRGPIRFELLWQQMVDEQEIAGTMRELCKAMKKASKVADEQLRRLFWNLDCDALLRMYQTCVDDGAPFFDYLTEFVSRSIAWEVRNHPMLRATIDDVSRGLADRATSGAEDLARRFHSAGQKDQAAVQELMHQFFWLPLEQQVLITDIDPENLPGELDRKIPYGAVVAFGAIEEGEKVWVHITQPCDLLRFSERFETDSLMFVEGKVVSYGETSEAGSRWVVRALKSSQHYFDLDLSLKRPQALNAKEFVERLRDRSAVIIGQLRSDMTREVGHQLSHYMSRIDRPRFTDMRSTQYCILIGAKDNEAEFVTNSNGEQLIARAILRTIDRKKKCFHLLDGVPEIIAIWCQEKFGNTGLQATEVAHILKGEIVAGTQAISLSEHCDIRVLKAPDKAKQNQNSMRCSKAVGIALVPVNIAQEM